jgi:hypothetical protein
MRILKHTGKYNSQYWLADNPKRTKAAFQILFNQLDKWFNFYIREKDIKNLELARRGNADSIAIILYKHINDEYERFEFIDVSDPLKETV